MSKTPPKRVETWKHSEHGLPADRKKEHTYCWSRFFLVQILLYKEQALDAMHLSSYACINMYRCKVSNTRAMQRFLDFSGQVGLFNIGALAKALVLICFLNSTKAALHLAALLKKIGITEVGAGRYLVRLRGIKEF